MLVGYRVVSRVALGKPFVAVVVFFVVVSLLVAAASAAAAVFAIPVVVVVAVPSAPAAVVSWIACFKTTIFSATSTDAMFSRWCFCSGIVGFHSCGRWFSVSTRLLTSHRPPQL